MNDSLPLSRSLSPVFSTAPLAQAQEEAQAEKVQAQAASTGSYQAVEPRLQAHHLQSSYASLRSPALLKRSHSLQWIEFSLSTLDKQISLDEKISPPEKKAQKTLTRTKRFECFEKLQQLLGYLDNQTSRLITEQTSSDQDPVLQSEKLLKNLSFSDMTYDLHQEFIQAFLQQTQINLTDYFSSLNNAKIIEIDETHPSFIAMPMDYQQMEAVAKRAFTNAIYAKDDPRDGCYARAELAALDLDVQDRSAGKVFVTGSSLCFSHPNYQNIAWRYHVAAAAVSKEGILFVIDPCASEKPMLLHHWLEKFVVGDSVKLTFTHARYRHNPPSSFMPIAGHAVERIKQAKAALDFLATKGYSPDSDELAYDVGFDHALQDFDYQKDFSYQQDESSCNEFTLNLM